MTRFRHFTTYVVTQYLRGCHCQACSDQVVTLKEYCNDQRIRHYDLILCMRIMIQSV